MRWMLALLVAAGGCRAAAAEPRRENPLNEQARGVLATGCGRCHDGAAPTAKPAALAVYDLSEPHFADRLSPARLARALHRLEGAVAPDDQPKRVHAADVALFAQFVTLELARRAPPK